MALTRQERIEALCAATLRAFSGQRDLHFRTRRLHQGRRVLPLLAPHLSPPLQTADFSVFRGAADAMALSLLHHDEALHRRLTPAPALERLLFDLFEQLRVEALATWPGMRANLRGCFAAWSQAFHAAGHTAGARGLLLFTVVQMLRARLTGEAAIEPDEGLLEATRAGISPWIGSTLAGLRRNRGDQAAYAVLAAALANQVAERLRRRPTAGDADQVLATATDDDHETWAAFNFWIEQDSGVAEGVNQARTGRSTLISEGRGVYRIYTRAYDREAHSASLSRAAERLQLRRTLDTQVESARINCAQLARHWQALLACWRFDGWVGAQEEGQVDGSRLAQLVATPTERHLFKHEHSQPTVHALVTLLVDCSGSMRQHAPQVAVLADLLARSLERAGAACEVLGFTTGAWNGGRALRDWRLEQQQGRSRATQHPGRLNEALHIVFKDAQSPWRHARQALAVLLKEDLFREGLDGEAVVWALQRAQDWAAQDTQREHAPRLLLVVSDGSPMDSATQHANDPHYLDHHLRDVVWQHEQQGGLIYGLGVGRDLSPYYRASHVLDLQGGISMAVFGEVLALLARSPAPGRA